MASGQSASAHGLNTEGLKRRGFSSDTITELKRAYRTLYRKGLTVEEALAELAETAAQSPEVAVLVDSVQRSQRGIIR
jgi:UDP-N-acetylglucosamine acyltransferase